MHKTPLPVKAWIKNLPNHLTLARMAVIPLLLIIYPLDIFALNVICALIFGAAAITDYIDGYVARKYDASTPVGALLDPVADKLLVTSGLILITNAQNLWALLAAILISRELVVSGIRLLALEKNIPINVNQFGKLKTASQYVGIFFLMINEPIFDIPIRKIGMLAIWIALGFSLYSAYLYADQYWQKTKR